MKRIIPVILWVALTSCNISAQKATLSGTITGLPTGSVAILNEVVNEQLRPIDTLSLNQSGSFKITLTPSAPTLYFYLIW